MEDDVSLENGRVDKSEWNEQQQYSNEWFESDRICRTEQLNQRKAGYDLSTWWQEGFQENPRLYR